MSDRSIKAILFDLGNVIVKVRHDIFEKNLTPHIRKQPEGGVFGSILGSDNINKFQEGKITSSQFYSRTCRYFKMKIPYREFYDIWNSMFELYPEMEEVIKNIRKNYPDIRLVLLSDTNETHYEFLRNKCKALDLFDEYVLSYEVGRQKPHPQIFRKALRSAGAAAKNTFYADDRADLIEAARVMGIRAFQFTGHEKFLEQLAKFGVNPNIPSP